MARIIGAVGRALVTAGLLILGFVAYQLWGTGVVEARAQDRLRDDFAAAAREARVARPDPAVPPTAPPPPPSGEAVAVLRIPRLDLERAVVEGVGVADLRTGPGHYPLTPLPGQRGNAAIAGHRTTYGAPFHRLDELAPGDLIEVTTLFGTYRYRVTDAGDGTGHRIVSPREVSVLDPIPDPDRPGEALATLTLTTCHPKYSARQRLVVQATLDPRRSPPPAPPGEPRPAARDAALTDAGHPWGTWADRRVTGAWAAGVALVGGLWWAAFRRRRRWWAWTAGAVPFLAVLVVFYAHLERLIPQY